MANSAPDLDLREKLLLDLLTRACDDCANQYEDYYKSFAALDAKAQATITASGVILAAVVAFVNARTVAPLISARCFSGYLLIIAPAVGAVVAALLSIIAARVTDVLLPYGADEQISEVRELCAIEREQFTASHALAFYHSRLTQWGRTLAGIARNVQHKGTLVRYGQLVFLGTLLHLMTLFFYIALGLSPC